MRKGTSPQKALSEILQYKGQVSTDLMKDGIDSEPAIIEKYSKETNVKVQKSGLLFLKPINSLLLLQMDSLGMIN